MSDFFRFSDARGARIEPLLPPDARGRERVDDRRVLGGIVHAPDCGGRRAGGPREVYGPKKTRSNRFVHWAERGIGRGSSSGRRWVRRIRPTSCSSTAVASRSTAAPTVEKGKGPARGIGRTKGGCNTGLHVVCDGKGRPLVLLLTPGNVHDCKVARRCIEACRRPPNSWPARAATARLCATGRNNAAPGLSSRRARTARSGMMTTRPSPSGATSSRACSAASRTGAASQPASTATARSSWPPSPPPPPSSGGCHEPGAQRSPPAWPGRRDQGDDGDG